SHGPLALCLLVLPNSLLLVLTVVLINTGLHRPWLESFLFALALAVGLTPELLPMIVSVCLARGALRMAAKKVIVKRLAAIHDLGSMDVLCTDKTGTLTEARIELAEHPPRAPDRAGGAPRPPGSRQPAGPPPRLPQQPLRNGPQEPAGRSDPQPCDGRRRRGLAQDRRGAVRLRAPPGFRASRA